MCDLRVVMKYDRTSEFGVDSPYRRGHRHTSFYLGNIPLMPQIGAALCNGVLRGYVGRISKGSDE
jgi:hypothetical protein